MRHAVTSIFASLLTICTTFVAQAQPASKPASAVPRLVKFSGNLTDSSGHPLNGTVGVTFALYEEEHGGAPLWMENQNVQADASGRYAVMLGSTRNEGIPAEVFASGQGRWLGVQAQGETERPRVLMASVPYALRSVDAETLGGLPASAFVLAGPANRGATSAEATESIAVPRRAEAVTPDQTGSGTANYITIWTGTTTLGNSKLYQTTAGNVGVGTTAATAKLEGVAASATGTAVLGQETSTTGVNFGVAGKTASSSGTGVQGLATATSGFAVGVNGQSSSPSGNGVFGQNLATTGPGVGIVGQSSSTSGTGTGGNALATSGTTSGVAGFAASPNGNGVFGSNSATSGGTGVLGITSATSGFAVGVNGQSSSPSGNGVFGQNLATTGLGLGIVGQSSSTSGTGTGGNALATSGTTNGVAGFAASPNGNGVFGSNNATSGGNGVLGITGATSGFAVGVNGQSSSPNGNGVFGLNLATTGPGQGVVGQSSSTSGTGTSGNALATSGNTNGVTGFAASPSGNGVFGNNSATSGFAVGVNGQTASPAGTGVNGVNTATTGGNGGNFSSNATSGYAAGVYAQSSSTGGVGVNGSATATSGGTNGVYGSSASSTGFGVQGVDFAGGVGVQGSSPNVAVAGFNQTCNSSGCTPAPGVAGEFVTAAGGTVLSGIAGTTQVFYVDSSGNGYFAGNLKVTGRMTKGSGSFMIDHPLDPENKYLSHSFVESPDMMNVYNGIVRLDAKGAAWVDLPDYFEALNGGFRYQLTAIGAPAPRLYVAKEVTQNRFKVAGGTPGGKVSWQVTGIRHDAYANAHRIPVTEDKPLAEQGTYLHPDVFGRNETKASVAGKP
jgi:hypothetical protein